MKQEKFGAPIGNQNAKGGDSNGGDIEKEVSETRATLKNKIKDVAPGGKWNEAGTVYTVKMQPNKNDRWDAPEALNKLDGLTGYAGASWDDNGNVTISTRTDDWIKRSIEVKKGYAKANKQEKLERVKSFAEAGRKLFGAPLGNKNAAGGGDGGEPAGDKNISKMEAGLSLSKDDVENIIHDEKDSYFKGENHSRAKVVLNSLAESNSISEFKNSREGELYKRMPEKEQNEIHAAIKRYKK